MEEARQDTALVPNPLGLALVLLKLGELSSEFVAIILAFAASRYMLMAVNALGIFIRNSPVRVDFRSDAVSASVDLASRASCEILVCGRREYACFDTWPVSHSASYQRIAA